MAYDATPDWFMVCAAVTAFSVTGFVIVAALWLRKLRMNVGQALAETANQHIRTAQHLNDELDTLRKRQAHYEMQIQTLAQAGLRLKQEIVNVSTRLEHSHTEQKHGDYTVH